MTTLTQMREAAALHPYCQKCNAPTRPHIDVLLRCGTCAVVNGKLPPTKYKGPSIAAGAKGKTE